MLSQRTLTPLGVSRSLLRSVGLDPMRTVVAIAVEGLFVAVAEVLMLVQGAKVEATIPRTVAEVVLTIPRTVAEVVLHLVAEGEA